MASCQDQRIAYNFSGHIGVDSIKLAHSMVWNKVTGKVCYSLKASENNAHTAKHSPAKQYQLGLHNSFIWPAVWTQFHSATNGGKSANYRKCQLGKMPEQNNYLEEIAGCQSWPCNATNCKTVSAWNKTTFLYDGMKYECIPDRPQATTNATNCNNKCNSK